MPTRTREREPVAQSGADLPSATLDLPSTDLEHAIDGLLRAAPRCAFAGEIGAAGGLADIIAFVHQNRWSGTLRVLQDGATRELRFRHGEVRTAFSSRPQDRLGELLFRYGRISRAQLAEALATSAPGKRLGQVLMDHGLIGSHDLFTFVKKQVEEIFFSLLALRTGSYCFERVESHELGESLPDLGFSTRQLLFDGARLMDEMLYFKERIPSSQAVPVHRPSASNLVPLGEEARLVLALVDGHRNVEEIGRESRLGEIEATRVLFQLMSAGRIELKRELSGLMGDQHGGPRRLVEFLNNFLATVQGTLASCGAKDLLRAELESFFQNTTKYADLFRDVELGEDVRLAPEQVIANLARVNAGDQLQYLQRGLHELLCFLLFVVGDTVGIQRQQQLSLVLIDANRSLERDNRLWARAEPRTVTRETQPVESRATSDRRTTESRVRVVVGGEEKLAVLADDGALEAALSTRDFEPV